MKIVKRINLVKLGFRAIDFLPVNLVSLEYKSTEKKMVLFGPSEPALGAIQGQFYPNVELCSVPACCRFLEITFFYFRLLKRFILVVA